jgi:hypothetical protein
MLATAPWAGHASAKPSNFFEAALVGFDPELNVLAGSRASSHQGSHEILLIGQPPSANWIG